MSILVLILLLGVIAFMIARTKERQNFKVDKPAHWGDIFFKLKYYTPDDLGRTYSANRLFEYTTLLRLKQTYTDYDELVEACKRYKKIKVDDINEIALVWLAGAEPIGVQIPDRELSWYTGHSYKSITGWNSTGADYIVINLDRHPERLAAIARQFKAGAPRTFFRFPAIDGRQYLSRFKPKWSYANLLPFTPGRLGIYLSVMEICASLINEPPDIYYYTVLEDDVTFVQGIPNPADIVAAAPRDWWMIFLGVNYNCYRKPGAGLFTRLNSLCMPGGFAYILSKKMARHLIKFFEPIERPIDNVFQMMSDIVPIYAYEKKVLTVDYKIESSTRA